MDGHISAFPSAWVARYANIPKFPARSILPEHDGDMVWLRQTAQQIIAGCYDDRRIVPIAESGRWFFNLTIDHLGYNPRHLLASWPADVAGELLREWKAQR